DRPVAFVEPEIRASHEASLCQDGLAFSYSFRLPRSASKWLDKMGLVRTDSINRSLGDDDTDEHMLTFPLRINGNQEMLRERNRDGMYVHPEVPTGI
ncbi:hypothetical protein, partial [Pseudomonas putida]|uniref:hypothetical protein n=1 Tax=Pseudomonas putida TaxID=303 RepID=UPI001F44C013